MIIDDKKGLAVDCAIVALAAIGLIATLVEAVNAAEWIARHVSVTL